MLNKAELVKQGWTPALIAAVLGQPDQVERHTRGYKHWEEHLYSETRVRSGTADPRFVEAAERRKARAAAAAKRRAEIPTRYAGWREALADAAPGMFGLNRYAKHRTCSAAQKYEIYGLKNRFVRLLYERGYSTAAWIHRLELAAQVCRECGGDGGADMDCLHCDGSGVWRPARTIEFWCFRFVIAGRAYCWHQPLDSVEFAPAETVPPQDWEGLGGEKPVALPRRQFAHAKALLRWVIEAAAEELEVDREAQCEEAVPFDDAGPPGPHLCLSAGEQMALFAA